MDRGGWWAGLGMMDGWQVAVVVGEETVDHQKGGWRNKEKKLNKGDLLRPMMVIWISKERGDQGLSNDLTIKGIGQEMSEIWRVQEVKNSGNWGGLPEVDMGNPGQGRTVEALREVLGWGGSRRDRGRQGKGKRKDSQKQKTRKCWWQNTCRATANGRLWALITSTGRVFDPLQGGSKIM